MTSDRAPQTAPEAAGAAGRCRSGPAILAATLELLAEDGLDGLTVDGVAARAKVGKATIYRHWRSRTELVREAMGSLPAPGPAPATGDLEADLRAVIGGFAAVLNDPTRSRLLSSMIDGAERDAELAELHAAHSAARRAPTRHVLADAVARGDLPPGTDVELAVDLVAGPLLSRCYIARQPITDDLVARVVHTVVDGLRHRS